MKIFFVLLTGITSFVGAFAFCEPDKQEIREQQNIFHIEQAVQYYENSGDYASALEVARNGFEKVSKQGNFQEIVKLAEKIDELEKNHLSRGASRLLFDESYQPRDKLLQLFQTLSMPSLDKSQKPIVQINAWSQNNLLRQGERWHQQTDDFESLKSQIKPFLTDLGFVKASFPKFKTYDGAIIHGASLTRVRLRLHYLIEQWQQGVRFSTLYFLGGERPLDPEIESWTVFMDKSSSPLKIKEGWLEPLHMPKTECEMMQIVWQQAEIPEDMRQNVKVYFVNASMKQDPNSGKWMRPTTDDTVQSWLAMNPSPGRYLAITNAPYVNRQDMVMRSIASKNYGFDTVGYGADEKEKMAIFLDELARLIFQTKKFSENDDKR